MVVKDGVTEVPDSEEEPMTSSPVAISDKLLVARQDPLQASQGASQDAAQQYQAPATPNSEHNQSLVGDLENALRHAEDVEDNLPADAQVINHLQQHDVDMNGTTVPDYTKPTPAGPSEVETSLDMGPETGVIEEQTPMSGQQVDTIDITASANTESETAPSPRTNSTEEQRGENWQEQEDVLEKPSCSSAQATDGNSSFSIEGSVTNQDPALESSDCEMEWSLATTREANPQSHEMIQAEVGTSGEDQGACQPGMVIVDSQAGQEELLLSSDTSSANTSIATGKPISDSAMPTEKGAPEISTAEASLATFQPSLQTKQIEKQYDETGIGLSHANRKQEEVQQRCLTEAAIQSVGVAADSNVPISEDSQTISNPLCPEQNVETEVKSDTKPKTPAKSSQEVMLAELKAQRTALIAALAALPNIQELLAEDDSPSMSSPRSHSEPTDVDIMAAANTAVKKHIKLLHEYNEIKDAGQGLMGLIADQRGVRIVEVQDEFGVGEKD